MKLANYLHEKHISHTAFAQMIGASQTAVTRYAAGARTPRPQMMRKIAEATDGQVTALDFVPDEEASQ